MSHTFFVLFEILNVLQNIIYILIYWLSVFLSLAGFWKENLRERTYEEDLGIGGRIKLN